MRVVVVLLAILVAACGDDDKSVDTHGDSDVTSSLAMTLDSTAITVAPGTSQTVGIHLARLGAIANSSVNFIVGEPPSGVTIDLQSPIAGDTATLTLTATEDAPGRVMSLPIAAESDGYGATASLTVTVGTPPTISVHGRYSGRNFTFDGASIALSTAVAGSPLTTTTAADGTFTFNGVTPPYDLAITWSDPDDVVSVSSAMVVQGLTRDDPFIINVLDKRTNGAVQTIVHVTQTFSDAPVASDIIVVAVTCPTAQGDTKVAGNVAAVDVTVSGYLGAGDACTIDGVEWSPRANGFANRYQLAHATVSLSPTGTTPVNQAITYTSYIGTGHNVASVGDDARCKPAAGSRAAVDRWPAARHPFAQREHSDIASVRRYAGRLR